jgi:hypothetical protein
MGEPKGASVSGLRSEELATREDTDGERPAASGRAE